jgi:hypothetical protein
MKEAERAFAEDDYDRAEHLADVVIAMFRRDTVKYQADPQAWMAQRKAEACSVLSDIALDPKQPGMDDDDSNGAAQ